MRRLLKTGLILAGLFILAVYLNNASWLAPSGERERYFVSHRGVHQAYDNRDVGRDDCTAGLISPPRHGFIENTIPSIRAAFEAGAAIVEIDIHPTTDDEFAVFHDWTLDCRTDGAGVTREQSMDYIRTLDAGYGYTADGGETYPLRGTAVGQIPSFGDVLDAFPDRALLINFKSRDANEADRLSDYLTSRGEADFSRFIVYGGAEPTERFVALHPRVRGFHRRSLRECASDYLLTGWTGRTPQSCRNTVLMVPRNYAWLAWGWPRRLEARMEAANTLVWVIGDWDGTAQFTTGLDDPDALVTLPRGFTGGVWTNRIEDLGPGAQADRPNPPALQAS